MFVRVVKKVCYHLNFRGRRGGVSGWMGLLINGKDEKETKRPDETSIGVENGDIEGADQGRKSDE